MLSILTFLIKIYLNSPEKISHFLELFSIGVGFGNSLLRVQFTADAKYQLIGAELTVK